MESKLEPRGGDSPSSSPKVGLDHYYLLRLLGRGAYGKVLLVKKKDTGVLYALKVIKKEILSKKKQEEYIITERNVLITVNFPFIIRMACAFQNERKIFFALEFCPGGELRFLLQKVKVFNEDQARFYTAQIVLALEYLHSRNILYRDLKPENILLDAAGYIRLTDFGLSKQGVKLGERTYSICGTLEYLAPEVLSKNGSDLSVDWWTLGAVLYEMLTGLPPFYTSNREELLQRIRYDPVKLPKHMSTQCKGLLEGLFQKDPSKRFGVKEIKSHPWFDSMKWDALLSKSLKAPFVPRLKSDADVSNFDKQFTAGPLDSAENSLASLKAPALVHLENFTYTKDGDLLPTFAKETS